MNFGYKPPQKELVRQRPPELVLIADDENDRSPNTSLLIEKKMQGTPDTAKLADDMVGGENWEFQMDPFDTWSHEKENNHRAPRLVDGEMPKRSFFEKALCRKPKMMQITKEPMPVPSSSSLPVTERLSCIKSKSNTRRKPESLFPDLLQTPQKVPSSSNNTPSKYKQQLDEFIEVSATPKQLNRVADLSDIEKQEQAKKNQLALATSPIVAAVNAVNATYSQSLVTPALDDGNSVVVKGDASVRTAVVSLSPVDTSASVVQQQSNSILSAIRCGPLCNAGEMLFMAVGQEDLPKELMNEQARSPLKPQSKRPDFQRIHRSMPASTASYLEQQQTPASSFQGSYNELEMKENRVQSYSPSKNHNRYSREAFEKEIQVYQKSLRESRNQSKMKDIQERDEYGESTSPDSFKSRRAMHQANKKSESNPHRRSRSVGRSQASSSSSSSASPREHKWGRSARGRSAREDRKGRSKSTHRSSPLKSKEKHRSKEASNSGLPRKRSDFMIAGMEMVTGDIERHRSLPKKEQHHRNRQPREQPETRVARMKPEWMISPNLCTPESCNAKNVFHSESGPVPVGDVLSIPSSSNKLPIRTLEIPVMMKPQEDLRILKDASESELDSAAFDEFDSESIYEDLKKTEKRRRSIRSTKSVDASEMYSRYSRKSGATRHTDFTYGSASVEYDGCF
ncbi:MAG: hypothetical protein SGBAC_002101 [Bacillariaceae sp.]